jgi:DNA-binding transcriptional LysR family regulator
VTEPHLQARKIGTFRQVLVASPGWASQLARLKSPEGIATFPFVGNTALREHSRWTFLRGRSERRVVVVHPTVSLDATLAVREAVCQGIGLSVLPDFAVAGDQAAGRLIEVLPQWSLPAGGIYAVYPSARYRAAKVRAFVDLLTEHVAQTA